MCCFRLFSMKHNYTYKIHIFIFKILWFQRKAAMEAGLSQQKDVIGSDNQHFGMTVVELAFKTSEAGRGPQQESFSSSHFCVSVCRLPSATPVLCESLVTEQQQFLALNLTTLWSEKKRALFFSKNPKISGNVSDWFIGSFYYSS